MEKDPTARGELLDEGESGGFFCVDFMLLKTNGHG